MLEDRSTVLISYCFHALCFVSQDNETDRGKARKHWSFFHQAEAQIVVENTGL